ncbi:MAG: hypothetical protein O7G87_07205, partial [bacterium]|nr:hypothetical protein [bacterium]
GIDDTAIDPDLERPDVLGYRVYRSDFMRVGPWKLIATIPKAEGPSGEKQLPAGAPNNSSYASKYSNEAWIELNDPGPAPEDVELYKWGTYTFIDKTLEPGFKHLYSIRAYDEQGLEIGNSDMRRQNSFPVTGVSLKVVSFNDADRMATPIRVVPNPWVQGDNDHSYGAARIRFINVPSRAKLFIYTITGDLIWRQIFDSLDPTVGQPNPTAEFEWDTATVNLNINTTGRLNAGTYIWAIESLHPDSFGQVQKGIFLIVN